MYRFLPLLLVLALVPGCGLVLDLLGFGDRETGSSELKAFQSEKELTEYFSQQITARNNRFTDISLFGARGEDLPTSISGDGAVDDAGGTGDAPALPESQDPGAIETDDAALSDDFSQTTIQEEGVDEADVVKTDGTYLYIIDSASGGSLLRIVRAQPPEQLGELGTAVLQGYGREIYLHEGKVVALTETFGGFVALGGSGVVIDPLPAPDATVDSDTTADSDAAGAETAIGTVESDFVGSVQFERPRTIVTVVDVSTPENPTILSQTKFDGTQSSSRMIDGVLHLVLSNFQDYYYDVLPMLGQPELDLATVDTTEFLPKYERADSEGAASGSTVTWREMYRPTDPDGFGVVTVVSLDVDNDAEFTAVGVVAEPGLIYSSLNALYLTDTEFDFSRTTRETTDIYKFAYVDRGAEPVATGSVPGRILNQYSMGEYQGHLRVATTVGPTFSPFGFVTDPGHNSVYVLEQSAAVLQVIGRVEDIAPRETIQSARFVGDRGYIVTFEQIDPFFTMDLSDPRNPRVVGELKIPGFSTFLVPMDADHILAVGQYIPEDGSFFGRGVQLSIFDVSDFANPRLAYNVVLGAEGGAYSEALRNPKAFTYFAQRGLVALPINLFDNSRALGGFEFGGGLLDETVDAVPVGEVDSGSSAGSDGAEILPDEPITDVEPFVPPGFDGLVVYSVSAEEGFREVGVISTRFEDAGIFSSSFTRGVFIADDVFAVTNHGVRGAPLANVQSAPFQLLFQTPATPDLP
jgi:hypothetical protein